MARVAKKRTSFGSSMGVSSIIAILVILVLVVFSVLSITTSKADLRLSQKTSDGLKAFYNADSTAEDKMAEVAAAIANSSDWRTDLTRGGYTLAASDEGTLIKYTVPIDDNRNLNVELLADPGGKLTRELWQVVPAKPWTPDESVHLINP